MSEHDTTTPERLPTLSNLGQLPPMKLGRKDVEVPEWGVTIPVWEMTGDEVTWWIDGNTTTKRGRVVKTHNDTASARLFMKALKNEACELQYTLAEMKAFVKREASIINRLERVALELSGLDGDEDEKDEDGDEGND